MASFWSPSSKLYVIHQVVSFVISFVQNKKCHITLIITWHLGLTASINYDGSAHALASRVFSFVNWTALHVAATVLIWRDLRLRPHLHIYNWSTRLHREKAPWRPRVYRSNTQVSREWYIVDLLREIQTRDGAVHLRRGSVPRISCRCRSRTIFSSSGDFRPENTCLRAQ